MKITKSALQNFLSLSKIMKSSQTPMAHTCNPSYLGGWDQEEDRCWRPPWTNSLWDPISKITKAKNGLEAGHRWLTPVILATLEAEVRRILVWSQTQANSSEDPMWKITNTKKGLVVECLPSKPESLSSNSNPTEKIKYWKVNMVI
jgi:hypothetical protein